ncbi:MAG: hypothetical protein NXH83_17235 [Rhodobacteraceae bacterium]|nr:hypothetical protein [Paracoccaceae bacterium]
MEFLQRSGVNAPAQGGAEPRQGLAGLTVVHRPPGPLGATVLAPLQDPLNAVTAEDDAPGFVQLSDSAEIVVGRFMVAPGTGFIYI